MSKYLQENEKVGNLVRDMEENFTNGTGTLMSKYVTSDLYEDINKIYAYINSKHVSGPTDSQGRDKPFFNIVLAARNIWYRATDLDRKHVNFRASKNKQVITELFATAYLQEWMRKEDFGTFLNKWGLELATFKDVVVKFVETQGELHAMVIPWSRLIVDPINFDANPKIEILELTEAELYKRVKTHGYDKEMVEKLCDARSARELTDGTKKDQRDEYIKLYEVHGEMELSMLTGKEEDDDVYVQQMHVVTFIASKEKGRFDDFTLVSGREDKDPYMLTSLFPSADGSVTLDGSVKNLFEAQWMMNHSAKAIKDQLDLANKLIFQTADKTFLGKNALTAIQNGDILVHEVNMPLTQFNNTSHDITTTQNFANTWKSLANEINGISESMLGNTAPSGTAWRQVEALLQESHSLFEVMTENKGLDLERMLRQYVLPFIKKKADNKDEIMATLDEHNIQKLDAMYVPNVAARNYNERLKEQIIPEDPNAVVSPYDIQPYDQSTEEEAVRKSLAPLGNRRPLKPNDIAGLPYQTWKEILDDMDDLEVDITGEQKDKQSVMTTLNTALVAVTNPNYANNPAAQLIISKVLAATGAISPVEIASLPKPAPVQAQVGGPNGGLPVTQ